MTKSYNQKAAVFWSIFKSNPKVTGAEIQRRYKGTAFSMRKADILDLLKNFRETKEYKSAKQSTKKYRISKQKTVKKTAKIIKLETATYDIEDVLNQALNILKL